MVGGGAVVPVGAVVVVAGGAVVVVAGGWLPTTIRTSEPVGSDVPDGGSWESTRPMSALPAGSSWKVTNGTNPACPIRV